MHVTTTYYVNQKEKQRREGGKKHQSLLDVCSVKRASEIGQEIRDIRLRQIHGQCAEIGLSDLNPKNLISVSALVVSHV